MRDVIVRAVNAFSVTVWPDKEEARCETPIRRVPLNAAETGGTA